MSDEAHLSAKQPGPRAPSRVSRPDGNSGRTRSNPRTPRTGPQEAVSLILAKGAQTPSHKKIPVVRARKDFLAANGALRAANSGFVLLARNRDDDDPKMRLGITVTKKIGNAVVRNRMKRRLRALARELFPERGLAGHDHILIGRPNGIERDFGLLREDLTKALRKVSS